ncbi:hypothetical protein TRFO_19271 [Tritrichomonas foetus]|uniref:Nucleoporin NSP1-like C-terminal domain-containing protein n=1 Tax=Tritrichomonas foetus TaxID=1144522 RepID=A0A1J4KIY2_9EUKA|nr:hypothetical protein TRFO_19271 [Tritrichomonas foetus]|eukprot:OHT11295.1 hypothetical protein TRFO_19271 [Tritrichomonas foetus]
MNINFNTKINTTANNSTTGGTTTNNTNPFAALGNSTLAGFGSTNKTQTTSTDANKSTTENKTPFGFAFAQPAAKADEKIDIPPELQKKTVKMALESFEKEMEEQIQQFQIRASEIKRRDRSIFDCLELLLHLGDQIQNIEEAQSELINQAEKIKREQEAFLAKLSQEGSSSEKANTEKSNTDKENTEKANSEKGNTDRNDQRNKLYNKAGQLGKKFQQMTNKLNEIKEQTDKMHKHSNKTENDIDKIKKIANCHLNAMRWIDHQTDSIEERLNSLQAQLQNF